MTAVWIRSQDREDLILATSIFYEVEEKSMNAEIWARTGMGGVRVATYETQQVCIEVLDMIEYHISNNSDGSVFKMPQK